MTGCEGYHAIANVYDRFNADLNYEQWADFIEACFARYLAGKPELVLDLACGTGRMTRTLAARGYDMIGADGSADMLSEAVMAQEEGSPRPLYLCQDMRCFELYGTVGAVVCCLDSLNYLLEQKDLEQCFATVHNYLDPDGIFLFDVNTPYRFANVYGNNAYILEEDGIYCGWQNEYDAESGICEFYLTLFRETEDGSYLREEEHQRERCYSRQTLEELLKKTGFEVLGCFEDFGFSVPSESVERWYFAARCKK